MTYEQIAAYRLNDLGLGIYEENGTDGNIYINMMPEEVPEENELYIAVRVSGSYGREPLYNGQVVKPLFNIYVKSKNALRASEKAQEIANTISNDSYIKEGFKVLQSFVIAEPVLLEIDESGCFIYSLKIIAYIYTWKE